MAEESKMAKIENLKVSKKGFELKFELHNFPVTFVNALRRIILNNIPTVVVQDVQILKNTTKKIKNTSQTLRKILKNKV